MTCAHWADPARYVFAGPGMLIAGTAQSDGIDTELEAELWIRAAWLVLRLLTSVIADT
jgi:hypothetical protein